MYYECLPVGYLSWRRAMQFSRDASMRPSWFAAFEISHYEKENSLDVQNIDRPDSSYDLLVLNHVLECVPDAKASFRELMRILSPEGVLQISFSKPHSREVTVDFAEPYTSARFFHHFGRDVADYFAIAGMGVELHADETSDPVTRTRQDVHFFSRDRHQLELLKAYSGLRRKFEAA